MVRKFTKKLVDLYGQKNIDISEALKIISYKPGKTRDKVALAAKYIYEELETGNYISNAFKTCPYINFDEIYVSFLSLAERTGDLRKALNYLNLKYERTYENKLKLLEVSIYPCFVIVLSVLSCFFLITYFGLENRFELLQMVLVLLLICSLCFFIIARILSENRLYEAFMIIDFLLQSGVGLSSAVACGVNILGVHSKMGKAFEEAREKLEFGMSLQSALKLGKLYEEGFYFADKAGGKTEVFGNMAVWINQKEERKRRICINIVEPVFILIAGLFLLTLMIKYFIPLIVNIGLE